MRACLAVVALTAACGGSSSGDDDVTGDGSNANPTMVSVTLTNHPTDAARYTFLAAYQDGDGAWTAAPAPSGDTYSFPVTASTYGFAWTCIAQALIPGTGAVEIRQVVIARFGVGERPALTLDVPPRCTDRDQNVALTGTVSNLGNSGNFLLAFGDRTVPVNPTTGAFQLMTPIGTHDLIVMRVQSGVTLPERVIDRALVSRALAVNGPTTKNLDFSTSAATVSFPVTVTATGRIGASTTLYSAGGTTPDLVQLTSSPYESRALATSQTGDLYEQAISVGGSGQLAARSLFTSAPAAQTWDPPAPLGGTIASIASATPYPRVMATWGMYANAVGYTWQATQPLTMAQCAATTPCVVSWSTLISPEAAGSSPSFAMPDLSALAGWSANLQPIAGSMINGFAQALTSSAGASDFPPTTPPSDGTQRAISRSDYTAMP